jgi:hypothetical protein
MARAWNRVCSEAQGKYLLFCADDDILCDRAVDLQVEVLERNPNVAFCHADFVFINDDGEEVGRWVSHRGSYIDRGVDAWPRFLVATGCCMQTTVCRKNLWQEVGGWDEDSGNPADNSLYLKLLRIGDVGHVRHVGCKYRVRTNAPDTWEKRLRNVREYHALASKHLRNPPVGTRHPPRTLERRLIRRLALDGVSLAVSAPDAAAMDELREWLDGNVWPRTSFGRLCRLLDQIRCTGAFHRLQRWYSASRRGAKRVALFAMGRS